jgi:hypothetical protein
MALRLSTVRVRGYVFRGEIGCAIKIHEIRLRECLVICALDCSVKLRIGSDIATNKASNDAGRDAAGYNAARVNMSRLW